MSKWIALLIGRGPDPVASLHALRRHFVGRFADDGTVVRATFSTVDTPSVGSRMNFESMAVDALLEAWLAPHTDPKTLTGWLDTEAADFVATALVFRAREHVVIAPSDQRGRLKRITLIRRLPSLNRVGFERHWTEIHAAMARDLPHVLGYAQNILAPDGGTPRGDDMPDAIADMRFERADRVAAAFGSQIGKALIADTPRFCGSAASFETDEQILFDHGRAPQQEGS